MRAAWGLCFYVDMHSLSLLRVVETPLPITSGVSMQMVMFVALIQFLSLLKRPHPPNGNRVPSISQLLFALTEEPKRAAGSLSYATTFISGLLGGVMERYSGFLCYVARYPRRGSATHRFY